MGCLIGGCVIKFVFVVFFFFFFKQKTAYEIYQCDWSSDVCSSDLASVRRRGTALCDETGGPLDLTEVLVQVLEAFQNRFEQWQRGDRDLVRTWQSRCALTGRPVQVDVGRQTVRGMCCGIDADGALIVEARGRRHLLLSGSVRDD